MPHTWKKKNPGKFTPSNNHILEAVKLINEGKGLRQVAEDFKMSKSALQRHVKKYAEAPDKDNIIFHGNLVCGMVFSSEQETSLVEYLLTASKMHYGLTTMQVRILAFQYASALKIKFPQSWEENKIVGYDWFKGFMARHKQLSLRSPEATSLGRATSFNKANVDVFLNNLKSVYEKFKLTPDRIYNCDETGVSTVNTPPKVVAKRGEKQVGQVTSAERGEQITALFTINAIGNAIPPVFIFPRVRYKDFFLKGAPPGSLALASRTGWMSSDLFLQCLDHIVDHTKCTKDQPILLTLDNHESHVSVEAITKAKDKGIIMLTFPPHCSHRLQPLDVSVFGPFKTQYNRVCNDWLLNNPGKPISIYTITELVGQAYPLAVTQKNIVSGFQKTAIYPFNSEPFTDDDYLMSSVTDRPLPSSSVQQETTVGLPIWNELNELQEATTSRPVAVTPEQVRPFPKAEPRKEGTRGRRKGRSRILTSTPEKAESERLAAERERKRAIKSSSLVKPLPKKTKVCEDSDASSSEETNIPYQETDDELEIFQSSEEETEVEEIDWLKNPVKIEVDDFLLVKFCTKKSVVCYVSKVIKCDMKDEVEVQFLRKKGGCWKFYFPNVCDSSTVDIKDILFKLPAPSAGGTDV